MAENCYSTAPVRYVARTASRRAPSKGVGRCDERRFLSGMLYCATRGSRGVTRSAATYSSRDRERLTSPVARFIQPICSSVSLDRSVTHAIVAGTSSTPAPPRCAVGSLYIASRLLATVRRHARSIESVDGSDQARLAHGSDGERTFARRVCHTRQAKLPKLSITPRRSWRRRAPGQRERRRVTRSIRDCAWVVSYTPATYRHPLCCGAA